jgi:quercetin dioxygenase-like cupin family protein
MLNQKRENRNMLKNSVFKSRFGNLSELTKGQKSEGIMTLEPNEIGPPEHIHTQQLEYFEVISGELTVKVDGENIKLRKGEKVDIKKAVKHTYYNETNEIVIAKFGYEPSLNIEFLLDTFDKSEKKNGGDWNKIPILEIGFLLYSFRKEYRLAKLPFWTQDIVFGVLAKIARLTKVSDKIKLPQNLIDNN